MWQQTTRGTDKVTAHVRSCSEGHDQDQEPTMNTLIWNFLKKSDAITCAWAQRFIPHTHMIANIADKGWYGQYLVDNYLFVLIMYGL